MHMLRQRVVVGQDCYQEQCFKEDHFGYSRGCGGPYQSILFFLSFVYLARLQVP